jgi:hypothetical protein
MLLSNAKGFFGDTPKVVAIAESAALLSGKRPSRNGSTLRFG